MDELTQAFLNYTSAYELRRLMSVAYGERAVIDGYYLNNGVREELNVPSLDEILRLQTLYEDIFDKYHD